MKLLKDFLALLQGVGSTRRICKTRMIDDRFFECKVKKPNPKYCEHSLRSGGGFICNHEGREMFVHK
jgi:hypothetical protein